MYIVSLVRAPADACLVYMMSISKRRRESCDYRLVPFSGHVPPEEYVLRRVVSHPVDATYAILMYDDCGRSVHISALGLSAWNNIHHTSVISARATTAATTAATMALY